MEICEVDAVSVLGFVIAVIGLAVVTALIGCMRGLYAVAAELRALHTSPAPPPRRTSSNAADAAAAIAGYQRECVNCRRPTAHCELTFGVTGGGVCRTCLPFFRG
jgi:hypothetical protein